MKFANKAFLLVGLMFVLFGTSVMAQTPKKTPPPKRDPPKIPIGDKNKKKDKDKKKKKDNILSFVDFRREQEEPAV